MRLTALLVAATAVLPLPAGSAPERLPASAMLGYLAQSVCLDAAGRPNHALPIDPDCRHQRFQTVGDPAYYRKHDWPDVTDPRRPDLGYQASDSVVESLAAPARIVQTFDFGDAKRKFGHFDAGQGDGGQVLVLTDHAAGVAMTEDGGDGAQWFVAASCRTAPASAARFLGWLAFADDVTAYRWHEAETHLNKARAPDACPPRFNAAYTRYRLERLAFPFRIVAAGDTVTTIGRMLDVVVSEHYGGASIAAAGHLERFFFARGLGLVRWERWENPAVSRAPGLAAAARTLRRSARCPALDLHEAADGSWDMVDCRTWTNLVRMDGSWSVEDYRWPAAEVPDDLRDR